MDEENEHCYTLLTRTSGDGFWRVELSHQTLEVIKETMEDLRELGVTGFDMEIVRTFDEENQ